MYRIRLAVECLIHAIANPRMRSEYLELAYVYAFIWD